MQSVAPAASFHDTAGGLVDDLDLAVHDHVVHVLLEHGVGLQQLADRVDTLALGGEFGHQLVLLLLLLEGRQLGVLDFSGLRAHVGEHEEIVIADSVGEHVMSLVGHVDRMQMLVDHEEQGVGHHRHLPLVVLHVEVSAFWSSCFMPGSERNLISGAYLGSPLCARSRSMAPSFSSPSEIFFLASFESLVHEAALGLVELLHIGAELQVLGLVASLCCMGPEMIRGVRASSMSTESTSSTMRSGACAARGPRGSRTCCP